MNTLSLYIIFPDSDEDFISLGDDILAYMAIPKQLLEIKETFPKNTFYTLFYSASNIHSFCNKADIICGGKYLEQINSQIKNLIGNHSCNVDVTIRPKVNYYYRWNLDNPSNNTYENSNLIISATQTYGNSTTKVAIVSFKESEWNRDVLPIITDAKHIKELPIISNIPYFYPYYSFIEWYKENSNNRTFSLLNVDEFERTNYLHDKMRIYRNLSSGDYWYYDYFHKDNKEHFEVFDATGHHKGEANINGVIDTTKRDSSKSIAKVINGH